jgi:para-aminobenzoate synthetase component I
MMRPMAGARQTTGMPIGTAGGTPTRVAGSVGVDVLAVAERLRDLPGLAVLDSARAGRRSRWTYVTADPLAVVTDAGPPGATFGPARALLARMGGPARVVVRAHADARGGEAAWPGGTAPRQGGATFRVADDRDGPPFTGGLAGFVGYDVGRELERLPSVAIADQPVPLLSLALHDWVVAVDRREGRVLLCGRPVDGDEARLEARLARVRERLAAGGPRDVTIGATRPASGPDVPGDLRFTSGLSRDEWIDRVERIREAIAAGELYQANLARRLEAPFAGDPWPLFRALRTGDPATFAAYLDLGRASPTDAPGPSGARGSSGGSDVSATPGVVAGPRAIISASPEPFLAVDAHGRVETDPIKGTRPRGRTRAEDRALAAELLGSEKDRAENVMIVDVLRNDLGRVCRPGSVRVPRLCRLERTAAVQHLVSTVVGRLAPGHDAFDLLAAAFPGGSITGAPKIRAMRLIEEVEPVRRGPYCGTALWLGPDGALGSSILIRTFVADGRRLTLHVGGGITRRSDAAEEWEETRAKARGPLRAIGAEENGRS